MRKDRALWLLVCAAFASLAGYGASSLASGRPSQARSEVTSISVPYEQLAVIDGRLVLASSTLEQGEVYGDLGLPLGWSAIAGQTCQMAVVGPGPLRLGRYTSCPPLGGATVAVESVPTSSIGAFGNCGAENASVVAVRLRPGGQVITGPVVMRYGMCSDTHLDVAYGGGSLWVYDCATGSGGGKGQLVRLSATTGALEASISMPSMCRPTVAADEGGFWIGPGEYFGPGEAIYHVEPDGTTASLVLRWSGPMAWTLGVGDSLYADLVATFDARAGELWRFGADPTQRTLVSGRLVPLANDIQAGDEKGFFGLSTAVVSGPRDPGTPGGVAPTYRDEVVKLDPSTGAARVVAVLGPPMTLDDLNLGGAQLVSGYGAEYVLANNRLYRITA